MASKNKRTTGSKVNDVQTSPAAVEAANKAVDTFGTPEYMERMNDALREQNRKEIPDLLPGHNVIDIVYDDNGHLHLVDGNDALVTWSELAWMIDLYGKKIINSADHIEYSLDDINEFIELEVEEEQNMQNEQTNDNTVIGLPEPDQHSETFISVMEAGNKKESDIITTDYTNATGETNKSAIEQLMAQAAALGLKPSDIAELVKKQSKPAKPAKVELMFEYPGQEDLDEDGSMMVPLASLVLLEDTDIKGAKSIIRPINQDNVERMVMSLHKGEPLPAMLAVLSNKGVIMLGGRHRRLSYLKWLKDQLTVNNNGVIVEPTVQEVSEAAKNAPVRIKPVRESITFRQALMLAFRDNDISGTALRKEDRVQYGFQLYQFALEDGDIYDPKTNPEGVSFRKIADIVGCTREAFSMAMKRERDKKNPAVKIENLAAEDREDVEAVSKDTTQKETKDVLSTASLKLFGTIETIYGQTLTVQQLTDYFTQNKLVTPNNLDAVSHIISTLQNCISHMPAKK